VSGQDKAAVNDRSDDNVLAGQVCCMLQSGPSFFAWAKSTFPLGSKANKSSCHLFFKKLIASFRYI
jgi:hypothetical protein